MSTDLVISGFENIMRKYKYTLSPKFLFGLKYWLAAPTIMTTQTNY
jgi:hypothetical protein